MPPDVTALIPLLEAISFAARAHRWQVRKDARTPYVSHPCRVCTIVHNLFGVNDPKVLQTAILHDTIEDTTTDADDIIERFGEDVATWVGMLSKDKRLPEVEREQQFMAAFSGGPWQVQVCKLGDLCDNLLGLTEFTPEKRMSSLQRYADYLVSLGTNIAPEAKRALVIVRDVYDAVSKS